MTSLDHKDINLGANDGSGGGVYYSDPEAVPKGSGRRGQLFLGFCCDMRRAVLIVNFVYIAYIMTTLGVFCIGSDHVTENWEDDTAIKEWNKYSDIFVGAVIVFAIVAVAFAAMGLFGALRYSKCLVMTAAIWYCIIGCLSVLGFNVLGIFMSALFAYPHFVFAQELKQGIMTEENYRNEVHSCCCV
jgi:hypothetical protein